MHYLIHSTTKGNFAVKGTFDFSLSGVYETAKEAFDSLPQDATYLRVTLSDTIFNFQVEWINEDRYRLRIVCRDFIHLLDMNVSFFEFAQRLRKFFARIWNFEPSFVYDTSDFNKAQQLSKYQDEL